MPTSSLSQNILSAMESRRIGSAAVVATVDAHGGPHTAPFGSICFVSPQIIRFGCDRRHETFENIRRNGEVVVSLVAPPDIAVSIKGHARVAKEHMELVNTDAVIEVGVEDVKDDLIPGSFIVSGILYSTEKHVKDFIAKYVDEVRKA
jgi:pyridoxamine 5'-phosphate oxidase-like protein